MNRQQLDRIHMRDPFILADEKSGRYYLYGSIGQNVWEGAAIGFDTYVSEDLVEWEGPIPAFRPSPDFWSDRHYWAPEVYAWEGRYVMFASFKSDAIRRGTAVLTADSPEGPFEPLGKPITPADWECLDDTLYVDEAGAPWMIFCREWVEVKNGEMYAMRLLPDLSGSAGEPMLLFRASDAPWAVPFGEQQDSYITDGPFLHRIEDGQLVMLWSTGGRNGYTMGLARSATGRIEGPWVQDEEPVFAEDGGHGMLFRTFGGELCLPIHAPNKHPHERPVIYKVQEEDGKLRIIASM